MSIPTQSVCRRSRRPPRRPSASQKPVSASSTKRHAKLKPTVWWAYPRRSDSRLAATTPRTSASTERRYAPSEVLGEKVMLTSLVICQAGDSPQRPELAHHPPNEAQPLGDVAVVDRSRVVAHLQLHLETHAREVPGQALEAPDARIAVLHEEPVEAHSEEAFVCQPAQGAVALPHVLGNGGHRLAGTALAREAGADAKAHPRPARRAVVRVALQAGGIRAARGRRPRRGDRTAAIPRDRRRGRRHGARGDHGREPGGDPRWHAGRKSAQKKGWSRPIRLMANLR
jgi:hypothetical protein